MNGIPTALLMLFGILIVILVGIVLARRTSPGKGGAEKVLREEMRASRQEATDSARSLREEVAASQREANQAVVRMIGEMN